MPRLVGERVYLRPLERHDIDNGWLEWINDQATAQYLYGQFPVTRDDLVRYYEASQPPKTVMFALCIKESDKYVGNARLSEIDWLNRRCEYGRIIGDSEYRAKGYGSEALVLLLRYGFHELGMNRMYTAVFAENHASLASNEKVGMKREGILREAAFRDGRFHDTIMVAMLRSEFDQLYGGPADQ